MLHNLLKKIVRNQRKHEFVFLNDHPTIEGNCIYASNHSCKWDFQYMVEIAEKRFTILAGKQRLSLIDCIGFEWNGVVWVDRRNKKSKNDSKNKLMKLLQKGRSILIFPEATWNLEPSSIMLPLHWGIIDLAQQTNVPILPLALEYRADKCFVKFGKPIYLPTNINKSEAIEELNEVLATLRWELWEHFPMEKRSEVSDDFWKLEVQRRLKEYELLDYEYEMSCVRGK